MPNFGRHPKQDLGEISPTRSLCCLNKGESRYFHQSSVFCCIKSRVLAVLGPERQHCHRVTMWQPVSNKSINQNLGLYCPKLLQKHLERIDSTAQKAKDAPAVTSVVEATFCLFHTPIPPEKETNEWHKRCC